MKEMNILFSCGRNTSSMQGIDNNIENKETVQTGAILSSVFGTADAFEIVIHFVASCTIMTGIWLALVQLWDIAYVTIHI